MTITETSRLRREHLRNKGRPRTEPFRRDQAFFLIGYITALRDLRKLFRAGDSDSAKLLELIAVVKEQRVREALRKL